MVELVRVHGFDETDIVHLFLYVWQSVGNPLPALSRLMKWVLRPKQLRNTTNEREPLSGEERSRAILPIKSLQHRLMFKQFQLAGRPGHMEINHTTCFRRKLRGKRRERSLGIAGEIERGCFCSCRLRARHKL